MSRTGTGPVRTLNAVRAGWGAVLLAVPAVVGGAGPATRGVRAVVRVLGARQLFQAAVTAWRPTPTVVAAGAATDVLHAASMAALAASTGRLRTRAAADAALAAGFAAAGRRAMRTIPIAVPFAGSFAEPHAPEPHAPGRHQPSGEPGW